MKRDHSQYNKLEDGSVVRTSSWLDDVEPARNWSHQSRKLKASSKGPVLRVVQYGLPSLCLPGGVCWSRGIAENINGSLAWGSQGTPCGESPHCSPTVVATYRGCTCVMVAAWRPAIIPKTMAGPIVDPGPG